MLERGRIGIFNQSYYEEVLVIRVHPKIVVGQRIPGIKRPSDINQAFWQHRNDSINSMEQHLARNGTVILKFSYTFPKKSRNSTF